MSDSSKGKVSNGKNLDFSKDNISGIALKIANSVKRVDDQFKDNVFRYDLNLTLKFDFLQDLDQAYNWAKGLNDYAQIDPTKIYNGRYPSRTMDLIAGMFYLYNKYTALIYGLEKAENSSGQFLFPGNGFIRESLVVGYFQKEINGSIETKELNVSEESKLKFYNELRERYPWLNINPAGVKPHTIIPPNRELEAFGYGLKELARTNSERGLDYWLSGDSDKKLSEKLSKLDEYSSCLGTTIFSDYDGKIVLTPQSLLSNGSFSIDDVQSAVNYAYGVTKVSEVFKPMFERIYQPTIYTPLSWKNVYGVARYEVLAVTGLDCRFYNPVTPDFVDDIYGLTDSKGPSLSGGGNQNRGLPYDPQYSRDIDKTVKLRKNILKDFNPEGKG